jgi:hypothetical protein
MLSESVFDAVSKRFEELVRNHYINALTKFQSHWAGNAATATKVCDVRGSLMSMPCFISQYLTSNLADYVQTLHRVVSDIQEDSYKVS